MVRIKRQWFIGVLLFAFSSIHLGNTSWAEGLNNNIYPDSVSAPLKGPRFDAQSEQITTTDDDTSLDQYIETKLTQAHMPGLSAAIVKNGEIVWTGAYGFSRAYTQQPVTSETLFMLASVSKTIVAVAVMQIQEDGRLDLDTDINTYLPFHVVNPNFPETPITPRMLLTHTSSIADNWPVMQSLYVQGDSSLPLGQFLQDYLTPGGAYYSPTQNFYAEEPGTASHYSNIGATLAAYLVEAITGIPFDTYCTSHIFEPLGMTETFWHLAGLDQSHIAMPYGYSKIGHFYHPYGFYGYPDYPDGELRTSALQLANFLNMFIQYGELGGVRLLQPETVEEMRRVQYPDIAPQFGLIWYYKNLSGWTLLGHNGGDRGVATEMFLRPEDGVGVILLMNGNWTHSNYLLIMQIEIRLFKEAGYVQ
jgi:CubicO group peptidase (beta-lactamase class C family)